MQIQPGTNFKLRSSVGIEFVVQLPIINAPFRLYWAYNLARLDQQIVAPASIFTVPDYVKLTLPPGVYQSQFVPQINNLLINPQRINFFEPASTFRFAVSRTF